MKRRRLALYCCCAAAVFCLPAAPGAAQSATGLGLGMSGGRPRSPEHLLKDGELGEAFAGWRMVIVRDGVERKGRFVSSILAQRLG